MELRECQECQQTIRGRADKRFCDDHCRNAFNNKLHSQENNLLRNINRKLRQNRNILQGFLGDEKMLKITKFKLLSSGYAWDYHTHYLNTSKGQVYIFCYEYGFLEIENGMLLLVRNKKPIG